MRNFFSFCIHSESIYDDVIYKELLKFAKDFYNLTAKKITVCVSTPFCPLVAKALVEKGILQGIFDSRVLDLNEFADIGYHGHFCIEDGDKLIQISRANYDKEAVSKQIRKEMSWFKQLNLFPKTYVAGWWFLTEDIVLELERYGVMVDVSVRKDKTDTFGTEYLNSEEIPEYGKPFILPPSRSIVEIQSIFGPVMPTLLMKYHLSKYLNKKISREPFFIFPLHDWDIPKYYKNIVSNVKNIERSKRDMGWMNILEMREYMTHHGRIEDVLNRARNLTSGLQPWPHYFESKAREFGMISGFYNIGNNPVILEIGCGNGFTSSLLAGNAQKVVAFDLPYKDPASHSIGIETAQRFIGMMDIKNVEVMGGSVEALPFDDGTFDIIFSEYMLQYVPDKHRAINEMRRVLKKDGVIITIVPNFMARLLTPIMQYKYLLRRSIHYIMSSFKKGSGAQEKSPFAADAGEKMSSGQKSLWDYFLLRPDGAYKSFREELICHMPWAWRRLFEQNHLKVIKTFSTELFPLGLFDILGYSVKGLISNRVYYLNRSLGDKAVLKNLGYSFGLVAAKI